MPDNEKKKDEQELKDLDISLEKNTDTLRTDDPSVEGSVKAGVHASVCGWYTTCGKLVQSRD